MLPVKIVCRLQFVFLVSFFQPAIAQQSPVENIFPKGTVTYGDISYANDADKKHLLDIYLPAGTKNNLPMIVWVHGGAWMMNDKYADMSYMKNTVKGFIDSGYAFASIDYRHSTTAIFPAQIQDCNAAIEFLYNHASEYKIDKNKIAVIGFSAGGHLASLLALSNNSTIKDFYKDGIQPSFKIKCAIDFYGPSDLLMLASIPDTSINNKRNPVAVLLGAMQVDRPDLAKHASPVTYVDSNDPPFLIIQGEKDESVPNTQSKVLSSWLTLVGVKNQLIMVKDAPHYGKMFDSEFNRKNIFAFLADNLR